MKKRVWTLLAAVILVMATVFPVCAFTYGRGADSDRAGDPTSILYNEIFERFNVDAFFSFSTQTAGEGSAEAYARAVVGELTNQPDVILYAHTVDDAYVYTAGKCTEWITTDMIEDIYALCNACFAQGSSAEAASYFFEYVNSDLSRAFDPSQSGKTIAVPYSAEELATAAAQTDPIDAAAPESGITNAPAAEQTEQTEQTAVPAETQSGKSVVKSLLICLAVGLLIALIVVFVVKGSYKPVQNKRNANEYLVKGSLNVTQSYENLVRKETSERKINNGKTN